MGRSRWLIAALVGIAAIAGTAVALGRMGRLSGEFDEVGGTGKLEFRGNRVYISAPLGMTYAAPYEVDGDRVIVKGGGGTQVYTRRGDTLDAGMGTKFVKKAPAPASAAAEEH
jgi:hypothetical protein